MQKADWRVGCSGDNWVVHSAVHLVERRAAKKVSHLVGPKVGDWAALSVACLAAWSADQMAANSVDHSA